MKQPINRRQVVERHNVTLRQPDLQSPLQIGNGDFGFTADITGMQSFHQEYAATQPLSTLGNYYWFDQENPFPTDPDDFPWTMFPAGDRQTFYPYSKLHGFEEFAKFLDTNPSKLNPGRIGLLLTFTDGRQAQLSDLSKMTQHLDLYNGILTSQFTFDNEKVSVTTVCHGTVDALSFQIESTLLASGRLKISLEFGNGNSEWKSDGADYLHPFAHQTVVENKFPVVHFDRHVGKCGYAAALRYSEGKFEQKNQHHFLFSSPSAFFTVTLMFSRKTLSNAEVPDFASTRQSSMDFWHNYWQNGAMIDFDGSSDPRAFELERRIILSLYLTKLQCSGVLPPAETGYMCNSWSGKFHLEMHWFHAAHFALWGRNDCLKNSLPFYFNIAESSREYTQKQGYHGLRFPKNCGVDGKQRPCSLGPFLLWQQPHLIFYSELLYQSNPSEVIVNQFAPIIAEVVEFMIDFLIWDEKKQLFQLGPPMCDAPEIYRDYGKNFNFNFELSYWYWGLQTAQSWRQRQNLPRDTKIDFILNHFPALTVVNELYVAGETANDTFTNPHNQQEQEANLLVLGEFNKLAKNISHPCHLGIYGMLNSELVDRETMRNTLKATLNNWNWAVEIWGWDYPLAAMTAARLFEPELCLTFLFMETETNCYLANGHVRQNSHLPVYLPANGALLYAVALMIGGFIGDNNIPMPGIPKDGSWQVRFEGFEKAF